MLIIGCDFHPTFQQIAFTDAESTESDACIIRKINAVTRYSAGTATSAKRPIVMPSTFIVGNDGIVYQKDLGPKSLEIVKQMELYNPDKTWQRTDDEWPGSFTDVASAGATPYDQRQK